MITPLQYPEDRQLYHTCGHPIHAVFWHPEQPVPVFHDATKQYPSQVIFHCPRCGLCLFLKDLSQEEQ